MLTRSMLILVIFFVLRYDFFSIPVEHIERFPMKRSSRISIFKKLAASKQNDLKGKHSRTALSKYLDKAKSIYSKSKSEISSLEKQLDELQKKLESAKDDFDKNKKLVAKCHEILKNMDFSGADEVRIGNDDNDVSYVVDGKRMCYDSDSHELTPYKKYKMDVNDSFDKDGDDSDGKELEEGVEINVEDM